MFYLVFSFFLLFFFSSRRRHTRYIGDWSSDVCSSDLGLRVSLALSFIVMFATEMINASSGLGHLIRVAESGLRFDLMYVSLVTIAILGYAGERLLRLARQRVLAWQEQAA